MARWALQDLQGGTSTGVPRMTCRVYCRPNGDFIVVPACMLAPREVERRFGPLRHCATVRFLTLPARLAEEIQRQFDSQLFATLPARTAEHLCPGPPPRRCAGYRR